MIDMWVTVLCAVWPIFSFYSFQCVSSELDWATLTMSTGQRRAWQNIRRNRSVTFLSCNLYTFRPKISDDSKATPSWAFVPLLNVGEVFNFQDVDEAPVIKHLEELSPHEHHAHLASCAIYVVQSRSHSPGLPWGFVGIHPKIFVRASSDLGPKLYLMDHTVHHCLRPVSHRRQERWPSLQPQGWRRARNSGCWQRRWTSRWDCRWRLKTKQKTTNIFTDHSFSDLTFLSWHLKLEWICSPWYCRCRPPWTWSLRLDRERIRVWLGDFLRKPLRCPLGRRTPSRARSRSPRRVVCTRNSWGWKQIIRLAHMIALGSTRCIVMLPQWIPLVMSALRPTEDFDL